MFTEHLLWVELQEAQSFGTGGSTHPTAARETGRPGSPEISYSCFLPALLQLTEVGSRGPQTDVHCQDSHKLSMPQFPHL